MTKERIRKLPDQWVQNNGQCKGFKYRLILGGRRGNLYEVDTGDTIYYEVVITSKRRARQERESEADFDYIEQFPSINNWGIQGWTIMDKKKALVKFIEINRKERGIWGKQ